MSLRWDAARIKMCSSLKQGQMANWYHDVAMRGWSAGSECLADNSCHVQVYRGSLISSMSDEVSKQQEGWPLLPSLRASGLSKGVTGWGVGGGRGGGSGDTINCRVALFTPFFHQHLESGRECNQSPPLGSAHVTQARHGGPFLFMAVSMIVPRLQDCAQPHTWAFSAVDIWSLIRYFFRTLK